MPSLRTTTLAAALAVAAALASPEFGQADLSWRCVTDHAAFCPRDSSPNGVLVFKKSFWVLEGWCLQADNSFWSSSNVWRSINGGRWIQMNSNPPYDAYSAFVVFKGSMWAFSAVTPMAFRSSDGRNWQQLDPPPFQALRGTVFRNKIWILDSNNNVWSSRNGLAWQLVVENPPWRWRMWPGWVVMKDRLWLIGGGIYNYLLGISVYYNDVWSSPDGEHWTLVNAAAPWPGRYWFGCAVFENKLWIIGGFRDDDYSQNECGNRNDVWFSKDGVTWRQFQQVPWAPRHAMFHWVANNSLWISSGYSGNYVMHNDVWRLQRSR